MTNGEWGEITTTLLDRHNDYIQIYVRVVNGIYELSDDGYALRDLEACGCGLEAGKRKELLQTALNGFAVELNNDQLTARASADNLSIRKHELLEAILAVNRHGDKDQTEN